MNRTITVFVAIIGVAIVSVFFLAALVDRNYEGIEASPQSPPASSGTVHVTIASSVTKQKWMEALIADFHAADTRTEAGSKIFVESTGVLSGGSMWKILDGRLKPVVWSPGAKSWVEQFETRWRQQEGGALMSRACRPSIYSPIGLAMWRPMAEALGWPDNPIGWQTIVDLAEDPQGWSRYGHPEWGKLKLGHPHPKYSSAGMLYLTSLAYGVTGKTDTLMAEEVYAGSVEAAMQALAQNTSKYGMISTDLLRLMAKHGPRFLHAVSAFEEGTVRLNLERGDELRFPVAFIFPTEGTFWSSHPYCILDKADWVDEEQVEAAQMFFVFLRKREQQALAVEHLLRPLDSDIPLGAPLSLANGADPRVRIETVPPLAVPSEEVSSAVIDLFMLTKRKAAIHVLLDTSGSMEGAKIRAATEATATFLQRFQPEDLVAVSTFNDRITELAPLSPISEVGEKLAGRVSTLVAGGATALHRAVCDAMATMKIRREADEAAGTSRLYGIVLLSDGADSVGRPSENQMFTSCLPSHAEADGVKVFPIAFGEHANRAVLNRIADVSGGKAYAADPASIERIYLKISAEQ